MKTLKIPYEDALDLLRGAGVRGKLDFEKVSTYVSQLPSRIKEEDVEGDDLLELYLDVKDALAQGRVVELLAPEVVEPGPIKSVADCHPGRAPTYRKGVVAKRPGIMMAAMELMRKASEKAPVTKKQIHEFLLQSFPDHPNPRSMKATADRSPYWAEYYYDVAVHKSSRGYWLTTAYQGPIKKLPSPRKGKK